MARDQYCRWRRRRKRVITGPTHHLEFWVPEPRTRRDQLGLTAGRTRSQNPRIKRLTLAGTCPFVRGRRAGQRARPHASERERTRVNCNPNCNPSEG
jgi:hypothetical protein